MTERYVRTLVENRRISHYKFGKYLRFDLDELDEWVDAQRVEAYP